MSDNNGSSAQPMELDLWGLVSLRNILGMVKVEDLLTVIRNGAQDDGQVRLAEAESLALLPFVNEALSHSRFVESRAAQWPLDGSNATYLGSFAPSEPAQDSQQLSQQQIPTFESDTAHNVPAQAMLQQYSPQATGQTIYTLVGHAQGQPQPSRPTGKPRRRRAPGHSTKQSKERPRLLIQPHHAQLDFCGGKSVEQLFKTNNGVDTDEFSGARALHIAAHIEGPLKEVTSMINAKRKGDGLTTGMMKREKS